MLLSFEQLLIFMLAVTANIYITAYLVIKAFGFLPPSEVDNNLYNYSQIRKNYKSEGVNTIDQMPEEYIQEVPEELGELANAGDINPSDVEYNLARIARVKELKCELEQLKTNTTLKDFINVPEKLEPLTIYDIPEEEVNSSDLYDDDVEIITPEYEKFIEEKMRR